LPDDLDERLEHLKPYDIPTDMLAAVETVCQTLLAPAREWFAGWIRVSRSAR